MNTSTRQTQSPALTARRPGDPEPDLIGIVLAHRAMVTDVGRIARLMATLADERSNCPPHRARAVSHYLELLCDSIHHHHTIEDQVLWPVIAAVAGDDIDLTELTEDHAALDPRLDRLRALAASFRLSRGEPAAAQPLAGALAELHALLHEHIAEEEHDLLPVVRRHVSVADWAAVDQAAQRDGRASFDLPRMLAVATDAERDALTAHAPLLLRLLVPVLMAGHRRLERKVFGR